MACMGQCEPHKCTRLAGLCAGWAAFCTGSDWFGSCSGRFCSRIPHSGHEMPLWAPLAKRYARHRRNQVPEKLSRAGRSGVRACTQPFTCFRYFCSFPPLRRDSDVARGRQSETLGNIGTCRPGLPYWQDDPDGSDPAGPERSVAAQDVPHCLARQSVRPRDRPHRLAGLDRLNDPGVPLRGRPASRPSARQPGFATRHFVHFPSRLGYCGEDRLRGNTTKQVLCRSPHGVRQSSRNAQRGKQRTYSRQVRLRYPSVTQPHQAPCPTLFPLAFRSPNSACRALRLIPCPGAVTARPGSTSTGSTKIRGVKADMS